MQNKPVVPKIAPSVTLTPTTNKWYSQLIWQSDPNNAYGENLWVWPLLVKATATGLNVCYPTTRYVSPYNTTPLGQKVHEYKHAVCSDMTVSIIDEAGGAVSLGDKSYLAGYTDFGATGAYNTPRGLFTFTAVKGMPWVEFNAPAGTRVIVQPTGASTVSDAGATVRNGAKRYLLVPHVGVSQTAGTRVILGNRASIAVAPDNSDVATINNLRSAATCGVTDTRVNYVLTNNGTTLETTYTLRCANNANPMLAMFPHHHKNLANVAQRSNFGYVSSRGQMRLTTPGVGNTVSFTTRVDREAILPILPPNLNAAQANEINGMVNGFANDGARWNNIGLGSGNPADTYWYGKAFGKVAQVAHIARALNNTSVYTKLKTETQARLDDWFDAKMPHLFYYDQTWRTLIGYPASYGSDNNLNDHHFHYGYFLHAAALAGGDDPAYAAKIAGDIDQIVRDVSNPRRDDTRYPFLRYFDVYEGHAWANGPALFASGNNQESSSESMMWSTGLALWAEAINNDELRNLAAFLHTTESTSIREYWFDVDNEIFPDSLGFVEPTAPIVWADGGAYAIWWGDYLEAFHGINFLPITGGSLYLMRYPDYLKRNQAWMGTNPGSNPNVWRDIHMQVKAMYDPVAALSEYRNNPNYPVEAGESRVHTLYGIFSLYNVAGKRYDGNAPGSALSASFGDSSYTYSPSLGWNALPNTKPNPPIDPVDPEEPGPPATGYKVTYTESKGNLEIKFVSSVASAFADIHFKVGDAATQSVRMQKIDANTFTHTIRMLSAGNIITHSMTYQNGTVVNDTPQLKYTYLATDGGFNAPKPCFKVTSGAVNVNVIGDAEFVDIVYTVGTLQQSVRMTKTATGINGNVFSVNIPIKAGDTLIYRFVYQPVGVGVVSSIPNASYIHPNICV
jgi:endoglucanase Acf2